MVTKQVYYDARSLEPDRGDQVEILVRRHGQEEGEWLTATYMGASQIYSYTTPYFKFLVGDQVRLINANDIREWRFTITAPGPQAEALPKPASEPASGEWEEDF